MEETEKREKSTVSVIMCTFNGSSYIKGQIQSILNQSYPVYEFLIFDDGSTDETVTIVNSIQQQYPIIRLFQNQKNLGYNINFAQALQKATGEVIAIADQDDIWLEKKIETMMHAWQPAHPLIYCYSAIFSGSHIPATPKISSIFKNFEGTDGRKIFLRNTVSGHAMMIRRTFLSKVLPFDEDIYYDWWLAIVAAYNGGVQYLAQPLVLHRHHEQNASRTPEVTREQGIQKDKDTLLLNIPKFIQAPGMPEKHKQLLLRFKTLIADSLHVSFHLPLFLFLIKYRHFFFSYKKGGLLILSHIKHSYRFARQTNTGKNPLTGK